jgi:ADP-heptose:LPS heptosyltransferase
MSALHGKLVFTNHQCPGDILMLTAAVRDFKRTFPEVLVGVQTRCGFLWDNNPNIVVPTNDFQIVSLNYKTPHQSNTSPATEHFIYAFHHSIERQLGISLNYGMPYPDLYLSEEDKKPLVNTEKPVLLINAGSKPDFPIKQWPIEYFQQVVDACKERYTVVQIGETGTGRHPRLNGVVSMLDKTPGRRIVQLMHQASAVITGVSFPMHLCAGLNASDSGQRKCIVLAGNREDTAWEKYPDMYYLQKPCKYVEPGCGCWKRWLPPLTQPNTEVCFNAVRLQNGHYYAHCIADISVEDVLKCLK